MSVASLAGAVEEADPEVVGRALAWALGAIICRAVHPRRVVYPCDQCVRFGRCHGPSLGRLLFVWVTGAPYGERPPTAEQYGEVGRLLAQLERVAAGQMPVGTTPGSDGL